MSALTPGASATTQQAVVEAALVLLDRMGLSPADLVTVPRDRPAVPTFAEYVPVVSAAVTAETRRAYGSYWNRVVEHWGNRRLDEPTPSDIRQLMTWVKTHVVARRNARGGRSAEEHLVAALPVPACGRGRADQRGRRSGPEGGQAAASAVHPPGRAGDPARGDQPDRRDHRRRSGAGHAAAAAAHRDGLPPRRRAGPAPGRRYDHLWTRIGRRLPWVRTQQISTHWIRHTTLIWVERNFGYAVARAYAGHTDSGGDTGATSTYVRASLSEMAAALAALTGEPHPLATPEGW